MQIYRPFQAGGILLATSLLALWLDWRGLIIPMSVISPLALGVAMLALFNMSFSLDGLFNFVLGRMLAPFVYQVVVFLVATVVGAQALFVAFAIGDVPASVGVFMALYLALMIAVWFAHDRAIARDAARFNMAYPLLPDLMTLVALEKVDKVQYQIMMRLADEALHKSGGKDA